ncbi:MAG: exosortase Q [Ideonella sp.]|nr:exosortase Q [Ideonella sp.]MCC7458392.1 exosortase Q [Nitrospira sp.]
MTQARALACRPVRLHATGWLALHALALWPHGRYLAERAFDGSDDPLGLLALAAVAACVAWQRAQLRLTPRHGWLVAALLLALIANGLWWWGLPVLAASLLAAASLACALLAWWPAAQPKLPLAALVVLALPWIASLQFYLGWPLRVLTAQLSALGLQLAGYDAARSGASMLVNGQLVIVDAPCSGVQLAWLAYFTAAAAAAATSLPDRRFARRIGWVGAIVLAGNVLRNSVLVALEARPQGLAPAWHEAIGLVALALVCAGVLALMRPAHTSGHPLSLENAR